MYSWSPASTASPSPSASPSLLRSGWANDILRMPPTMEKTVKIRKGRGHLGMTLEPYDKAVNGCVVNTLLPTGVIGRDGHIHLGDFVTKINNENLRGVTGSQARAILKRAEIIGTDITLQYIPLEDAERFKERHSRDVSPDPSVSSINRLSPKVFPRYYQSPYLSRRGLTSVPSSDALSVDTTSVDISQIDIQSTSLHSHHDHHQLLQHTSSAPKPTPEPTETTCSMSYQQPVSSTQEQPQKEPEATQIIQSRTESTPPPTIPSLPSSPPPPPTSEPPWEPPEKLVGSMAEEMSSTWLHDAMTDLAFSQSIKEPWAQSSYEPPLMESPIPEIEAAGSLSQSGSASSSQMRSPDYQTVSQTQTPDITATLSQPDVPESSPPRDSSGYQLDQTQIEAPSVAVPEHEPSPDYADTESIPELYTRGTSIEERPATARPLVSPPSVPVVDEQKSESPEKSSSPTEPVIQPKSPQHTTDANHAGQDVRPISNKEKDDIVDSKPTTISVDLPKHAQVSKITTEAAAESPAKTAVSRTSSSGSASTTVQSISAKCKFWGEPRTVELSRQPNQSFGISIVGGRVEVSQKGGMPGTGNTVAGIFIKSVLPDSPAGKSSQLNMGDRIISVNDSDLRNATHEQAVEVIRHATNPVRFVVQSIHSFAPHQIVNANDTSTTSTTSTTPVASRSATTRSAPPTVIDLQNTDDETKIYSPADTTTDRPTSEQELPNVNGHREQYPTEVTADNTQQLEEERESPDKSVSPPQSSIKACSEPPNLEDEAEQREMPTTSIESLRAKFSDLDGEVLQIIVPRKKGQALGISLAGHRDRSKLGVFVVNISDDSPLLKTKPALVIGDELLQVNEDVLHGKSHLHATSTICQQTGEELHFVVLRPKNLDDQKSAVPIPMATSPTLSAKDTVPVPPGPKHSDGGNSSDKGSSIESEPTSVETVVVVPQPIDESLVMPRPQTERKVLVKRGTAGFGITLTEGSAGNGNVRGIFITNVSPDSPSATARELHVGDQVLAVDGQAVAGMNSTQVADIMQKVGQNGQVELTLAAQSAVPTPSKQHSSDMSCSQQPSSSTGISGQSGSMKKQSASGAATSNPSTVVIEPGKETLIEIDKGGHGLGLSIVGGSDTVLGSVVIHEVYPDGAAANDGRLKPGDQLIEVNGQSLRDVTHDQAINMLRHTPSHVLLVVYRDVNMQMSLLDPTQIYNVIEVELQKKPGKGLGLSIVGRKSEPGVYLSEVVKGGAAEADGRLMQGDQILAVNGTDVTNALQEEVAAILKTSIGRVHLKVGRWKLGDDASSSSNKQQPINTQSQTGHEEPPVNTTTNTTTTSQPTPAPVPSPPSTPANTGVPTVKIESPPGSINEAPMTTATTTTTTEPAAEKFTAEAKPKTESSEQSPNKDFQPAKPDTDSDDVKLLEHLNEEGSESLLVELLKVPGQTLGMGIGRRSRGILVTSVQEGSAAAAVLKVGDRLVTQEFCSKNSPFYSNFNSTHTEHFRIMAVNGQVVTDQSSAVEFVKNSAANLRLQIARPSTDENPPRPLSPGAGLAHVVQFERSAGQDYGFSIVGGATEERPTQPILIKRVYKYGAARESALRPGDQLVRVNEHSLVGLSHHEGVQLLQGLQGTILITVVPMEHDEHPNPCSPPQPAKS